jgi:hypothetical protein
MKYTPHNTAAASSSGVTGSQDTGAAPSPKIPRRPTVTTNQLAVSGTNTIMGQKPTLSDPRILFGVKGPNPALKLEQISINSIKNDSSFYDELKKYYRLNRGRLRYWFSFWRLEYCEVVKASGKPQ